MTHKAFDLSNYLPIIEEVVASELGAKTKIVRKLGSGGQGIVYQILGLSTNSSSALKIVGTTDDAMAGRFMREVAALKAVTHPNLISIQDGPCSFSVPNVSGVRFFYYTMPYAELGSLEDLQLPDDRRQWFGYLLYLFWQICAGVHAMHEEGFVHRDLKPSNVLFLADDFHPVVADFGLAIPMTSLHTWTQPNEKVGTWAYMAPEQDAGRAKTASVHRATDIYALGKILYFLLTGNHPAGGSLPLEILKPLSPNLAFADHIIRRCTEPEAENRYQDIPSLQGDIEEAQDNLSLGTYLGLDPKVQTIPRLVVLEQEHNSNARKSLLKAFQGNTRRALTIRPQQRFSLRIRATEGNCGAGVITNQDRVIFFEEQDYYSRTVSITFSGEIDASKTHLKTKGLDICAVKSFGQTLVYEVKYPRPIRPYCLYKFEYSFQVPQPFGPDHDSIYLPITDYFGEVDLTVESELPLLRARSRLFDFETWRKNRATLNHFFSSVRDAMEPVPDFTEGKVKVSTYNPPIGKIFVLWWEYTKARDK